MSSKSDTGIWRVSQDNYCIHFTAQNALRRILRLRLFAEQKRVRIINLLESVSNHRKMILEIRITNYRRQQTRMYESHWAFLPNSGRRRKQKKLLKNLSFNFTIIKFVIQSSFSRSESFRCLKISSASHMNCFQSKTCFAIKFWIYVFINVPYFNAGTKWVIRFNRTANCFAFVWLSDYYSRTRARAYLPDD